LQIRDIIILENETARESLENPVSKFYLTAEEGNLYYYVNNEWKLLNEKNDDLNDSLSSQIDEMFDILSGDLLSSSLQYDFSGFAVISGINAFLDDQIISGDLKIQYNDELESISSLITKVNSLEDNLELNNDFDDSLSSQLSSMVDLLSGEMVSGALQCDFSEFAIISGSNTFLDDQIISGDLKIQYNDNLESVSSLVSKVNLLENNIDVLSSNQIQFIEDYYIEISGSINPPGINEIYELSSLSASNFNREWVSSTGNKIVYTETNGWEIQDDSSNTLVSCNGGAKPNNPNENPYNEYWIDLNDNEFILKTDQISADNPAITSLDDLISAINGIKTNIDILSANQIQFVKDYYVIISNSVNPSGINDTYILDNISLSGFDRIWESESGNKILYTQENGWEIQNDSLSTLLSCNGGTKPDNSEENPYDENWTDDNENELTVTYSNELIINEGGYINNEAENSVLKGSRIISQRNTTIYPENNKVYKHTLEEDETISINTSNLPFNYCMNFELWLKMPSSSVSFTFGNNIYWNSDEIFSLSNDPPDFSDTNMLYVLCFRYDGSRLLANLAYKIDLSEE